MKSQHLFAALAACLMATTAGAGPRVTETADALPAGDCELEAGVARDRASGAPQRARHGTRVRLRRGRQHADQRQLGARIQRRRPRQRLRAAGQDHLRDARSGPHRLGPGLWHRRARNGGASLRWQEATVSLVATRELAGSWLLHANLGVSHERESRQNSTLWSVGVESTDTLALAADVFGDDRSRPWISGGVGYSWGGGFSASVRLAQQFEQPRLRSVTLGLKLVF
jgi:hypothetical protein